MAVGVVAVGLLVYLFAGGSAGGAMLADTAAIRAYRIDGGFTGFAFAEISFNKDAKGGTRGERYVNIFADLNRDSIFDADEWIVKNEKAIIGTNYANRFSFTRPTEMTEGGYTLRAGLSKAKIAGADGLADKDSKKYEAQVKVTDIEEEFGLNVPGASEGLKRGVGFVETAYAEDFDAGISGNIPDLTGGTMDCFAIATANNLIKMTEENGRRGDLPGSPADIINDLKQDMQYNNGIINANFLTGKAAYVARLNLPITTREIKRPTKQDIEDAFTEGDAVEISTTMLRSQSGQANTGHVLTGVGASGDGGELGIAVHDPATPTGVDTFLVSETGGANPFLMINYPLWDGIVIIDAIYIQTWNQPASTGNQSGTNTTPDGSKSGISNDASNVEIKKGTDLSTGTGSAQFNNGEAMAVIEYQGTYIPVSELRVGAPHPPHATGSGCTEDHWHADSGALALDSKRYPDPNSGGCGYGTLEERPVFNYFPHDQLAE